MASLKALKDKIFEKVINPYLAGVLQHPPSIEMREGMLHIRDVEGPKKTGSVEARFEAMATFIPVKFTEFCQPDTTMPFGKELVQITKD
ncbi:40S ribosomal protein S5-1 [Hordeum vulgare]|nr:40S ribosomal protein S5-1 [Hordeum vulgare]